MCCSTMLTRTVGGHIGNLQTSIWLSENGKRPARYQQRLRDGTYGAAKLVRKGFCSAVFSFMTKKKKQQLEIASRVDREPVQIC